ncbi:MAG: trigger factor [Candidatus Margulisiibacteriota bacterium]|nr:trigger factor [Candidatus Margulisiibacteriota bacterium]
MKITKNDRKDNTVTLDVEVGPQELEKAVDVTMENAGKRIKIPGFRKGKAPKNILEKALDPEAIRAQAIQDLISEQYPKIVAEAKIEPVDLPRIDVKETKEDMPLVFSVVVDVYPEVKLGKYKGLKVEKKKAEITDEDVVKALADLQKRFAKPMAVTDRGIIEEDVVDLEIEAESEGAPIKRWPRRISAYPIGSNYISKEFEDNLMGMKIEENKEFSITLPKEYQVKELAGKEVKFKVKVNGITARELLPLDDSFASSISQMKTLDELKVEMKKNMQEAKSAEVEAEVKNKLLEEATKASQVDIPEGMIKQEIETMFDELKGTLARSNLTLDIYLKGINKTQQDMANEFRGASTARVKGKVVLKSIAEAEKIDPSQEQIDKEIEQMAQEYGKSAEDMKKSLSQGALDYIKDYLKRRLALDLLIQEAKIKEV